MKRCYKCGKILWTEKSRVQIGNFYYCNNQKCLPYEEDKGEIKVENH